INDGIKALMVKGKKFVPGKVDHWMDCGNKEVTVQTNGRILEFLQEEDENLISESVEFNNATVIPPCYIGENVVLKDTTIGPNVSVGDNTVIENSKIENSLIQTNAKIKNAKLSNAMIGNFAIFDGDFTKISIGDYSVLD